GDPPCLPWFKPLMLPAHTEPPNAFLGVHRDDPRGRRKTMPVAGACALRSRSARPPPAAQRTPLPEQRLITVRYEGLAREPAREAARLSEFLGTRVPKVALYGAAAPRVGGWRTRLRSADAELVEKVAREELTRLGYLKS